MSRREEIIVGYIDGRPDFSRRHGEPMFGRTYAKKVPKFVHGKPGMACLLHVVDRVEMDWYTGMGDRLARLQNPRAYVKTRCGNTFFLQAGKCVTCDHPKPGSVMCGRCTGAGVVFPKGKTGAAKVSRADAKDRLGCVEGATCESAAWDGKVFRG